MTLPPPPPPSPGTADDVVPPVLGKPVPTRWSWWQRITLRARLVTVTILLLAAGLGIAALTTSTVVSQYLVNEIDESLQETGERFDGLTSDQLVQATGVLPSDYYVLRRTGSVDSAPLVQTATAIEYGVPDIPEMSTQEIDDAALEPFTVDSRAAGPIAPTVGTEWRVITLPLVDSTGATVGGAFIGLPLAEIDQTVTFLVRTLTVSAVVIAAIGGLIAAIAVRRSMRPLREIEETAAGIAAGDLSRRVRPAPENTEVGSLANSLNVMLTHVEVAFAEREASEQRMRQFVSDASHELRTPVAAIRGYAELYGMGALTEPEQIDDTIARIEDSATRMGALVADLLALARLDEGRALRQDPVDVVRLAQDAAQDLHALNPDRAVTVCALDGSARPSDLVVTGDEDRLRQVVINLIGNVARHTPATAPCEIALGRSDDGRAVLEVRDHGPGVDPAQADRIFERFYRADASRTRESGGSGLGMAIVAAIVAAHRGTVRVGSTPGGGLTVVVTLP
ncbi:sensor histidine kinase [Paraoerskovia marina]|uniref:sensor histidine kinase n=1 Tax=Paraoerskovia marina TaxID=545619 RepID=UPI0009DCAF3E|nr:HAMP domain-containing sensor histidine kinase [Paraoerskovia marina]